MHVTDAAPRGARQIASRWLAWLAVLGAALGLLAVLYGVPTLYGLGVGLGRDLSVTYVEPGSPADRVGLRAGDRVSTMDGRRIRSRNHFRFIARSYRAGDVILLGLSREGAGSRSVAVTLEQSPGKPGRVLTVLTVAAAFLVVGGLVYALSPAEQGSSVFLACCLALACAYGMVYANHPLLGLLENTAFMVPSLVAHLFAVFPIPRSWTARRGALAALYAPGVAATALALWTAMGLSKTDLIYVVRWAPLAVDGAALLGFAMLLHTMITARDPIRRQQLKWIAWGVGVAAALNGVYLASEVAGLLPRTVGLDLANWTVLIVPVAFAFSILRYRLFDIDFVISRSLSYTVVALAVLFVYYGINFLLMALSPGFDVRSPAAIATLVVLLLVLLSPLQHWIQTVVERVLYARRPNYRQAFESMAREIASSLDLDVLLDHLLRRLSAVTQCERIQVYVRQPERGFARMAALGATRGADVLPADHPLAQVLSSAEELLCMPDGSDVTDDATVRGRARATMYRLALVLCVPLWIRGELIGWLGFGTKRNGGLYPRDERGLLGALASQCAVAIQNALLYRESQERARKLSVLNQMSEILTSTLELQALLERIVLALQHLFAVESASLLLLDPESGDLVFRVVIGSRASGAGKRLASGARSVAAYVMQTGHVFLSNGVTDDQQRYADVNEVAGERVQQMVAAPVRDPEETLGVIEIINRRDRTPFGPEDAELLTALAAQAAIVIKNARLYASTDQALTERVRELTTMQEVDRQLNASLDFEQVMDGTLRWAIQMTRASAGFVGLIREQPGKAGIWVAAAHGYPAALASYQAQPAPLDLGIAGLAIASAEVVRVGDVRQRPDYWAERPSTRSELAVPVKRDVRVIGVINLESDELDAFGEHEQALISRLADHAAIAIENARLYDDLVRAHASKGEFVSLISHELKAPMTIIKGYSELMQLTLRDELGEENAELLDIIMSNVEQMQTLIDDLLQLAHLESGTLALDRQPTQIQAVLGEVMASFRHSFDERDLAVTWAVAEDVPRVDVDAARLHQILANLISNAVKYTPRGGEIEVGAACVANEGGDTDAKRFVRCSVRDSGVGISAEDQQGLFGRFYRADHPLVRRKPGSGLGLSITKMLVEMHGGQVGVESALQQGSTFWFTVPVADGAV